MGELRCTSATFQNRLQPALSARQRRNVFVGFEFVEFDQFFLLIFVVKCKGSVQQILWTLTRTFGPVQDVQTRTAASLGRSREVQIQMG